MAISAEQCLVHLSDALTRYPSETYSPEALEWFAEVVGIVSAYSPYDAIQFKAQLPTITQVSGLGPTSTARRDAVCAGFRTLAQALARQLRLETNMFTTAHVAAGSAYDYFEEVRGLIQAAAQDILFCDPYLNADFIQRYVPFVSPQCTLRLLSTNKYADQLGASCTAYMQQSGLKILVRVVPDKTMHDRHLVVDGGRVWQSGASFKDGPKNAATSINEIVDTATPLIRALEEAWTKAAIVI